MAACASRHRMVNEETLQKRSAVLETVITNGHEMSEELPKWVPPTLSGQLNLAERMQVAAEVLGERIAQNSAKPSGKRKDPAKIVVSLSDPVAPLGRDKMKVYRYQCNATHCQKCPLAKKCLRNGSKCRTVKRLEGQELLDAQREKMADEGVKARYAIRGQTVERGFADSKGNRRWDRFHGRGIRRARTETGLMVLAQNALILDRLERRTVNSDDSAT